MAPLASVAFQSRTRHSHPLPRPPPRSPDPSPTHSHACPSLAPLTPFQARSTAVYPRQSIPQCLTDCLNAWSGSCSTTDASCICGTDQVYWDISACVQSDCTVGPATPFYTPSYSPPSQSSVPTLSSGELTPLGPPPRPTPSLLWFNQLMPCRAATSPPRRPTPASSAAAPPPLALPPARPPPTRAPPPRLTAPPPATHLPLTPRARAPPSESSWCCEVRIDES